MSIIEILCAAVWLLAGSTAPNNTVLLLESTDGRKLEAEILALDTAAQTVFIRRLSDNHQFSLSTGMLSERSLAQLRDLKNLDAGKTPRMVTSVAERVFRALDHERNIQQHPWIYRGRIDPFAADRMRRFLEYCHRYRRGTRIDGRLELIPYHEDIGVDGFIRNTYLTGVDWAMIEDLRKREQLHLYSLNLNSEDPFSRRLPQYANLNQMQSVRDYFQPIAINSIPSLCLESNVLIIDFNKMPSNQIQSSIPDFDKIRFVGLTVEGNKIRGYDPTRGLLIDMELFDTTPDNPTPSRAFNRILRNQPELRENFNAFAVLEYPNERGDNRYVVYGVNMNSLELK